MSVESVKVYCRECRGETSHKVLSRHSEIHRDEYACDIFYQIVSCLGCETKSFRKVFRDIEHAYPTYDNHWEVPEDVTVYPKAVRGHKEIDGLWELPDIVRVIYLEVLTALREESNVLAGLGLRAVVEAVCNDLNVAGKNLEIRINKLTNIGYISKNDAERLHGIRFMGNDAAHDIIKPKETTLSVALQIIEHLIASVYILDNKANKVSLDTTVSRYEIFENMLTQKLSDFNVGDEYPVAMYLGKDVRRIKDSRSALEQELIAKINSGEYVKLSVGKIASYQGSSEELQHFILKGS